MTFLLNSKLQNISALFFTIFRWISEFWDALFASRLKFSYSISFFSTFKKLKVSLFLHLFQITTMLGCFLYLKMAFKVEYFMQLTWSSSYQYLEIPRFVSNWKTNYLKPTSSVPRSVLTIFLLSVEWILSLPETLSNRKSFTFFQKILLSFVFVFVSFIFVTCRLLN